MFAAGGHRNGSDRRCSKEVWLAASLPFMADFAELSTVPAIAIIQADRDYGGHMIACQPVGKRIHGPAWHCGIPLATCRKWIDPNARAIGYILPCEDDGPDDAAKTA